MTFPIFPTSPLPAKFDRESDWRESNNEFDSGLGQTTTALTKPLYMFSFEHSNAPRMQQRSLEQFYNFTVKGRTTPFFIKDPYDQHDVMDGRTIIATGGTQPTTIFFRNHNSYHYWPDSADFDGWLTSNNSGDLTLGTDYILDQETGIVVFSLTATNSDFFTVIKTVSYFKKVVFDSNLKSVSPNVWEQFDIRVSMKERTR